jgi:hypothetical protein
VDRANVRVVEGRDSAAFGDEAPPELREVVESRSNHFYRHESIEPGIAGLVDLAMPPRPSGPTMT